MAANARVVIRKGAMEELAKSDGVARALVGRAQSTQSRAQGNAPVSAKGSHGRRAGYLRANIRIKYAKDANSAYADVVSMARTPDGFPYGRMMERKHPYLKPAIQ